MSHGKRRRLALIAAFAAALTAAAAGSAPAARCEQPCKAATAACMRARCRGLAGQTRRSCVENCRGIGGCAPIRTLAWVENDVRADASGFRQALRVRRGNCAPVTAMEFTSFARPDAGSVYGPLIEFYGDSRFGHFSAVAAFFQRISVMPDGSGVVFEVTDDVDSLPFFQLPIGIEEGFYFARTDGGDLRRLGPQSGVPRFNVAPNPNVPGGFGSGGWTVNQTDISPDGRRFVFTDWGPGPAGERATQIVTLDLASGERTVVTKLPSAVPRNPFNNATEYPRFVDDDTILFVSYANPDGMNPDRYYMFFTVDIDGSGLRAVGTPTAVGDSRVLPAFTIAGGGSNLMNMAFVDSAGELLPFQELFILDGRRLLQLTDFGRADTSRVFLGRDGRHAFFRAAADPLGANPSLNCQLFSVDTIGGRMRQLTHFREAERSAIGCDNLAFPSGCVVWDGVQDARTGEVVFYSSCNPFGANPYGGQLFAMRPDGSKLRQLTSTRGRRVETDGVVSVQLPGPWAYSARTR